MSENAPALAINIDQIGAGIEIKQKFNNKEPFSMTMRFNTLGSKREKPDLLDLMAQMGKKEIELFIRIKNNMDFRTNIAVLDFGELSLSRRNHLSNYLSCLVRMDLVKRIKCNTRHVYMVNPAYIIPIDAQLPTVVKAWNELK